MTKIPECLLERAIGDKIILSSVIPNWWGSDN